MEQSRGGNESKGKEETNRKMRKLRMISGKMVRLGKEGEEGTGRKKSGELK